MKKMMTIALDEEAIAQLRQLADSPRKIGEFLAGAVPFMAAHADLIKSHKWNELVIVPALSEDALYKELRRLNAETVAKEEVRAAEFEQRKAELEEMISAARASMDEAKASKAQLERLLERMERLEMAREEMPT